MGIQSYQLLKHSQHHQKPLLRYSNNFTNWTFYQFVVGNRLLSSPLPRVRLYRCVALIQFFFCFGEQFTWPAPIKFIGFIDWTITNRTHTHTHIRIWIVSFYKYSSISFLCSHMYMCIADTDESSRELNYRAWFSAQLSLILATYFSICSQLRSHMGYLLVAWFYYLLHFTPVVVVAVAAAATTAVTTVFIAINTLRIILERLSFAQNNVKLWMWPIINLVIDWKHRKYVNKWGEERIVLVYIGVWFGLVTRKVTRDWTHSILDFSLTKYTKIKTCSIVFRVIYCGSLILPFKLIFCLQLKSN